MAHVGMLLLAYAALVAQISVGNFVSIGGVAPDFLALAVVGAAFALEGAPAVVWAAGLGLLADCVGPAQLGLNMLSATLLVAFVQSLVGAEWRKSAMAQTLLGLMIVCAMLTGCAVAQLMLDRQPIDLPKFWPSLGLTAVYTSVLGVALRTIWKIATRFVPARAPEPRPLGSGRWDALNR